MGYEVTRISSGRPRREVRYVVHVSHNGVLEEYIVDAYKATVEGHLVVFLDEGNYQAFVVNVDSFVSAKRLEESFSDER